MQRFLVISLVSGILALLPGCNFILPQGMHSPEIASWRDFDSDEPFEVTILPYEIRIMEGERRQLAASKQGVWAHRQFTCDLSEGANTVVARELPDESLELTLSYFFPQETRVATLTKIYRGWNDEKRYPSYDSFGKITYPPPKGLFTVGMLEADFQSLPWQSGDVDIQGHDSEIGPDVYHFHSDDPQLPELLVTVYKGKVINVSGGRENTDEPPFVNPIPPPGDDKSSAGAPGGGDSGWVAWLFDLIFKK
jgi:hypothetical protein